MRSIAEARRVEFQEQLGAQVGKGFAKPRGEIALLDRDERAGQGSDEITIWCPCCLEKTVPMRNGTCGFCDTPLTEEAIEREASNLGTPKVAKFGNKGTQVSPPKVGPAAAASKEACISAPAVIAEKPAVIPPPVRIPRRRERRHKHGRPYTDEQIIARIRLWAEVVGAPPSKADWTVSRLKQLEATARGTVERHLKRIALYQLGDFPSETTVRDRFGSMNAALALAGFEPRPSGRPPTSGSGINMHPKIGRDALTEYFAQVQGLLDSDHAQLKAALYDLSISALYWADRIPVE